MVSLKSVFFRDWGSEIVFCPGDIQSLQALRPQHKVANPGKEKMMFFLEIRGKKCVLDEKSSEREHKIRREKREVLTGTKVT